MDKKIAKWVILIGILLCLVIGLFSLTMMKANGPEVQQQFTDMTEGSITPASLTEVKAFLDKNMKRLDEDYASHLLVAYEDYATRFINSEVDMTLLQEFAGLSDPKTGKISEEKLSTEELKVLYASLETAGIRMTMINDVPQLMLDYDVLEKQYKSRISAPLDALYQLKALEEESPCIENATLLISWGELAERAHSVEKLIVKYKDEHLISEDCRWMLETYTNFMLMGANNTPVFDYTTAQFKPEAKVQYEKFIKENPDSEVSWMLGQYFDYLKDNDYVMNYKDSEESKKFFDTCSWLVMEAEKRVYQTWTTQ